METLYGYDVLEKLTQVSMTRGGVTQLRTFVYNSDGQLTNVTQPETGTTSYTYAQMRIPGHADHDSGVMAITVPGSCRSRFRAEADHDSGLMQITFGPAPER